MGYLFDNCTISLFTEELLHSCEPFSCGDEDLDDFFSSKALEYTEFRMGKTFCFRLRSDMRKIVSMMTLSYDSIRIYDLPRSRRDAMLKITHHKKTLKRYPGVLIGRLAVNDAEEFKRKGIGSEMIDIVKQWYRSDEIKAGCRMLIVDALNKPEVLAFYRKNGFETLFTSEQQEDFYVNPPKDEEQRLMRLANPIKLETRLMFTDLLKD